MRAPEQGRTSVGVGAGFDLGELPDLPLAELPDFTGRAVDFTLRDTDFALFFGNGRVPALDPRWDRRDPCDVGGVV